MVTLSPSLWSHPPEDLTSKLAVDELEGGEWEAPGCLQRGLLHLPNAGALNFEGQHALHSELSRLPFTCLCE